MKTAILIFFSASILFGTTTLYRYYNEDTKAIEEARALDKSALIKSQVGVTRYKVFGQENSPVVVLIHSFNGFLESWNPNISALVNAGYKVIAYDLFGRGLSDRPRVKYDLSLFRNQLNVVLKELGVDNAHLVGSSFGCVIASDYSYHYPEKVDGLIMIGPAGWPDEGGQNPMLNIPILSDLVFHYLGMNILKPKVEAYFVEPLKYADTIQQWSRFASYPGFTRSALSTLKHSPVLDYTSGWEKQERLKTPTLFIWGKQDASFSFDNVKKLPKLIPHAKVVGVDNAAHWVNIEQAEVVNTTIVEFLNTNTLDH